MTMISKAGGFELHQANTPLAFKVILPCSYRRSTFAIIADEHGTIADSSNASQLKNLAKHGFAWAQINLRAHFNALSISERSHDHIVA